MSREPYICCLLLMLMPLGGCGPGEDRAGPIRGTQSAKEQPEGRGLVHTEMRGVNLQIDSSAGMEVRHLRGALEPTHKGTPPWFDDPNTFVIRIDDAEIAVSPASLAAMMNHYVFASKDAPVKDVEIEIKDGHLVQHATLKKKIPIRTTMEGEISVTPEGDLRLHPVKIKAGKLPVKGLLDLFDVELSELMKSQEERGLRIVDNDFILDPEKMLPPPRIHGRVTAVRIVGDRLVQTFGGESKGKKLSPSFPDAEHYMFYQDGELSFGKNTMHDADLQIIDADPKDPFNFFLAQYNRQLVAGYSRTMPDKGLAVYMPDSEEAGKGQLKP